MEIRFYDENMEFQGVMENQSALVWTRKYQAAGSFEIRCPATADNLALARHGWLAWARGFSEAGVVEKTSLQKSSGGETLEIGGRFLESYLDRRLVRPRHTSANVPVEEAMRALITEAEPLTPLLAMGAAKGFPERVTFQATYKGLLETIEKLAGLADVGFRIRPDFAAKRMTFETYRGLDRTAGQHDNPRAIFSEKFGNVSGASYSRNSQLMKNVCYVGGQGEGDARTFVTTGDDSVSGLGRREGFLGATDIQPESFATDAAYRDALKSRGEAKLAEWAVAESFECQAAARGNFAYKEDWDLGDLVTVRMERWGITANMRVTEVQEAYERGALSVTPTLGTTLPEKLDYGEADYVVATGGAQPGQAYDKEATDADALEVLNG